MAFGDKAIATRDGVTISSEDRLMLGLEDPTNPLALTQGQVRAVTQNRIRAAFSELVHGNIENVQAWLVRVAENNPARAVELMLELAQFSLPKLKAMAVDVRSGDGSVKTLSVSDLERIIEGGG